MPRQAARRLEFTATQDESRNRPGRTNSIRPTMNKKTVLFYILAAALTACHPQQKQEYAGVEGDTVNGDPLPERQEGSSFFGNNVSRKQFPHSYFTYDSSAVQ